MVLNNFGLGQKKKIMQIIDDIFFKKEQYFDLEGTISSETISVTFSYTESSFHYP